MISNDLYKAVMGAENVGVYKTTKTIGVTGFSGFLGQSLKYYLPNTFFDIVPISRSSNFKSTVDRIQDFDTIIHLAAKAHDLTNSSNYQTYLSANYDLTKNLFDQFLRSTVSTFIFVSSVKAVADKVEGILDENVVPNPGSDYGKSKYLAEEYLLKQSLPADKRLIILRPCMIHGPGNKGNLNLLYKFIKVGIPYPLAAFENKRSFLSAQNFCFFINEIISKPVPSGIYNLADDEPLAVTEVVQIISSSIGKKSRSWTVPKSLVILFSRVGDILKLPMNTERLMKLTENYIVSNNKIKLAIKSHLPITSREGLVSTAMSFNKSMNTSFGSYPFIEKSSQKVLSARKLLGMHVKTHI
ncbi:MAG: NAD-dependent epimerase/dehydratase family protein [Pedobacter sp.]